MDVLANKQEEYLEKIVDQMLQYAQLNFSVRLDVIDNEEVSGLMKGLAVGVNILGEELQYQVEEMNRLNLKLKINNNFINSLTESIPETIFVYHLKNNEITYLNKEKWYGFPSSEIVLKIAQCIENNEEGNTFDNDQNTFDILSVNAAKNELKVEQPDKSIIWIKATTNNFELGKEGNVESKVYTLTDITVLKEHEVILSESLTEKELLLQEVHHRVKNNLQIITSLLDMQTNRSNNVEVKEQLGNVRNRIDTIAIIHEEFYQQEIFAQINVSAYCVKLCRNLETVYVKDLDVSIHLDVDPEVLFTIEMATPFGLLINEVICNCYKHAFTVYDTAGKIQVNFKRVNESYILEIMDNGKGFDDTVDEKKQTLGNKLIKGLVMQLNGEMSRENNNGSVVRVIIPK